MEPRMNRNLERREFALLRTITSLAAGALANLLALSAGDAPVREASGWIVRGCAGMAASFAVLGVAAIVPPLADVIGFLLARQFISTMARNTEQARQVAIVEAAARAAAGQGVRPPSA